MALQVSDVEDICDVLQPYGPVGAGGGQGARPGRTPPRIPVRGPGPHTLSRSADGYSGAVGTVRTCTVTHLADVYGRAWTEADETMTETSEDRSSGDLMTTPAAVP